MVSTPLQTKQIRLKTSTHTNKQKGDGNVEGTDAHTAGEAAPKRRLGRPSKASKAASTQQPPLEKPAENSIAQYATKRRAPLAGLESLVDTGITGVTGLSPMSSLDERSDSNKAGGTV